MLKSLRQVLGRNYRPLNLIEISRSNLKYNYSYLSSLNKNLKVAPVLKSNAYGHGIIPIARILDKLNPPFICVDSLFEAYALLNANIKAQILIMGYIDPKSLETKSLPLSFSVYDLIQIQSLNKYQPGAKVHIFVDSGMHREGIRTEELEKFADYIKTKTTLKIEGLMSHFAMSDKPKDNQTKKQVEEFKKAKDILNKLGVKPKWIHIANSLGLINNKVLGNIGNMARVGLAVYGIDPEGKESKLKPILTLKTHIAQIKNLKKGEKTGYDFTFTAGKDMKIAILPIGYFDGVDRRLSSKGFVKIDGEFCPIIGKVNMNITVVDISKIKNPKPGDNVVIFSDIQSDKNSIQNTAKICGTIAYELPIYLSPTTRRVVI